MFRFRAHFVGQRNDVFIEFGIVSSIFNSPRIVLKTVIRQVVLQLLLLCEGVFALPQHLQNAIQFFEMRDIIWWVGLSGDEVMFPSAGFSLKVLTP